MKIVFYTMLALVAFAGKSVLCRLALGGNAIDAMSFMFMRSLCLFFRNDTWRRIIGNIGKAN